MMLDEHIVIINVDKLLEDVEADVLEDNHRFCLQNKSKLIKSFFVLRLCNNIFNVIEKNKQRKLLFYTSKSAIFSEYNAYSSFFYAIFIKLAKILSLTYLYEKINIIKFQSDINYGTGEGKEARLKAYRCFSRSKKIPNLQQLKKLLTTYNITSATEIDGNFNMKLGLFIT